MEREDSEGDNKRRKGLMKEAKRPRPDKKIEEKERESENF